MEGLKVASECHRTMVNVTNSFKENYAEMDNPFL